MDIDPLELAASRKAESRAKYQNRLALARQHAEAFEFWDDAFFCLACSLRELVNQRDNEHTERSKADISDYAIDIARCIQSENSLPTVAQFGQRRAWALHQFQKTDATSHDCSRLLKRADLPGIVAILELINRAIQSDIQRLNEGIDKIALIAADHPFASFQAQYEIQGDLRSNVREKDFEAILSPAPSFHASSQKVAKTSKWSEQIKLESQQLEQYKFKNCLLALAACWCDILTHDTQSKNPKYVQHCLAKFEAAIVRAINEWNQGDKNKCIEDPGGNAQFGFVVKSNLAWAAFDYFFHLRRIVDEAVYMAGVRHDSVPTFSQINDVVTNVKSLCKDNGIEASPAEGIRLDGLLEQYFASRASSGAKATGEVGVENANDRLVFERYDTDPAYGTKKDGTQSKRKSPEATAEYWIEKYDDMDFLTDGLTDEKKADYMLIGKRIIDARKRHVEFLNRSRKKQKRKMS